MSSENWINYLKGKIDKRKEGLYILAVFGIFFVILLVTVILYPTKYSIFTNYISDLGDHGKNPIGWPIFSLDMYYFSIFLIPVLFYIFRNLPHPRINAIAYLGLIFGIFGCIGMFFIGVFPEETGHIHDILSFVVFTGYGGSAFFTFINFLIYSGIKRFYRKIGIVLIIFLPLALIELGELLFTIVLQGLPDSFITHYTFWEWMTLLGNTIWVIGTYLEIPNH